jgi:hypothetical protein
LRSTGKSAIFGRVEAENIPPFAQKIIADSGLDALLTVA